MDLRYPSASRTADNHAYRCTTENAYHGQGGGMAMQNLYAGNPAAAAASSSTQPPFLRYPIPTKLTTESHTTFATAEDNRIYHHHPNIMPSSSFSSCLHMSIPMIMAQESPSKASATSSSLPAAPYYPRTPPPSRPFRPGHTRTVVSPPAPLRISSAAWGGGGADDLRYERIGPARFKTYRLLLPPELIHDGGQSSLDPIVQGAEQFAKDYLAHGWHTELYSLTKQDICLREIPNMAPLIQPIFEYVMNAIRILYGCREVVVDKNQPHILKYSVDSGHTGVQLHHDRCDVTANLALSRRSDYCGGGTYIPDIGSVIKLNYGECLLHPGSLVHGGMEVTQGTRYLMMTFAHLR